MFTLLMITACTDKSPGDSAPDMPSEYVVEDSGSSALAITPEEAADAVNAVFAKAVSINGNVLFQAYDEVMAYADPDCPKVDASDDGGSLWDTDCVATSGARYAGFISVFRGFQGDEYNSNLRGEATVITPDGSRLVVAGPAHTTVDEVNRVWKSEVDGVMFYDGPASQGSWIAESPDVRMKYALQADSNLEVLGATLDGAVGSLDGAVSAVSLSDIQVRTDDGFPCPAEPYGDISVRDAYGTWGDITFDVVINEEGNYAIEESLCDGCGTLWQGGDNLGQVCIDPSATLNTELPPW